MYCKKCGKELNSGDRYCPSCGTDQTGSVYDDPFTTATPEVSEPKPAKVWSIFATVGRILGIVSISTAILPILLGLSIGIPGIVLSCLGRRAKTPEADAKCSRGLKLSIVGVVISFVSYVGFLIIAGSIGSYPY